MLVYFGYTYCPDVCPTDLQMMSEAMDILGVAGERVRPLLISVDPERDTPRVLVDYVAAFHPRLIGLTGGRQEVKAVAKAYGVRYFKLYLPPSEDEAADDTADEDDSLDYAVHHTGHSYLVKNQKLASENLCLNSNLQKRTCHTSPSSCSGSSSSSVASLPVGPSASWNCS